ncbi:Uncharacterised protein [Mycobacteroides abscessus subsp. massiliense]|nr:Uncharacterised protein [Mycobacteroides abscessus subsp. massiliense]
MISPTEVNPNEQKETDVSDLTAFLEVEVIDPSTRAVRGATMLSVSKIVAVSESAFVDGPVTTIYMVGSDDYFGPVYTSMPYGEIKSVLLAPERAAA